MQPQVINTLPDILTTDLPGEVRDALDAYLDDKQSMLRMTERYIRGHDFLSQSYIPIIKSLKARKQESLSELRHKVATHCPMIDLQVRLADISRYLHHKVLELR